MSLSIGILLNSRYKIAKQLASGGFGAVYLAEDTRLGNRKVAVKETLPDPTESQQDRDQRAETEAKLLSGLSHRNVVQVWDMFKDKNGIYIVMQFIEGHDLMKEVEECVNRNAPLPLDKVLGWMEQVCEGLAYLHQNDIVHRDIKPQNMRVMADGTVVLIDLGIAKKGAKGKTGRLQKGGTPIFAPIEQCTMGGSTSYPTDIYAVGTTMFIMLTSLIPLEAPDRLNAKQITLDPPSKFNSKLPAAIDQIILRATHIDSTKRYKDGTEMLTAIRSVLNKPPVDSGYVPNFCRYCGWRNTNRANFCTKCGRVITHTRRQFTASPMVMTAASLGNINPRFQNNSLPSLNAVSQHYEADADRFYHQRRYDDAVTYYEKADRAGMLNNRGYIDLLRCLILAGRTSDALSRLTQIISKFSPRSGEWAESMGVFARLLYADNDFVTARKHASDAVQQKGDCVDALYVLGALELIAKNAGNAIKFLKKAHIQDPNDFVICMSYGIAESLDDQDAHAVMVFEHAISLEPQNAEAHYWLGVALACSKNLNRAKQEFQHVLWLNPQHTKAQDLLNKI